MNQEPQHFFQAFNSWLNKRSVYNPDKQSTILCQNYPMDYFNPTKLAQNLSDYLPDGYIVEWNINNNTIITEIKSC